VKAAQNVAHFPPIPALPSLPPDLTDLARRLAALPETVRAEIVAMVTAADQAKG
jgi:hypothetical protein